VRSGVRALAIALFVSLLAGSAAGEDAATGAPDDWPPPMEHPLFQYFLLFDQLEYRLDDGDDLARWEVEGWLGGDYDKVWIKTEGETRTSGPSGGDAEVQLLYGRTFSPFWDFQVGVRQDFVFGAGPDRHRTFAVLGVEGLAPYWFELSPALFVSDDGDVSARLTATYDLLFTQRLVAEPRFELNVAVQDAKKFGVEQGFNDVELGLRLRYELRREFAPYVGVNWLRKLGDTADLARREGEDTSVVGFVAGLRIWF
jgi:copper resistance protein B